MTRHCLAAIQTELVNSFFWHDRLLVGHPIIDNDHQRFFSYFAVLSHHLDAFSDGVALGGLFRDILADLSAHLAREEAILAETGFPNLHQHQDAHRLLGEQARAALDVGRRGEWVTALRLLAMSVLEHITEDDSGMRGHLELMDGPVALGDFSTEFRQ